MAATRWQRAAIAEHAALATFGELGIAARFGGGRHTGLLRPGIVSVGRRCRVETRARRTGNRRARTARQLVGALLRAHARLLRGRSTRAMHSVVAAQLTPVAAALLVVDHHVLR